MKQTVFKSLAMLSFAGFALLILILLPRIDQDNDVKAFSKKERAMLRYLQEIEMTKDPALGFVPVERLITAKKYRDRLIAKQERNTGKGAITGLTWTSAGPTNVGGRTRAIMFDPNDATNKTVFAGGVSGGLWKNTDITNINTSWTKVDDFMDNLAVTSIVADPQNSMTFYAATGEAYTSVTPGLGIFKSTDGGTTWSSIAATTSYKYIAELLIRVESSVSVLYMASHENYVGIESDDPLNSPKFIGNPGLFRSADGGANWTQVIPNNDSGSTPDVDDIALDASGNLWASTGRASDGNKGGDIYQCSTGCDMSSNWTKKYDASANGFTSVDRTVIATAPNDANYIYAVAGEDGAGTADVAYFIKSTNGGSAWSNLTIPNDYDISTCTASVTDHFTREQATYDLCLAVHPTNKNLCLMGGIDMFRTTDGWTSNQHISSWYVGPAPCDQEMHADMHAIVFRPGSPNEVIFGTDGGVYYSSNAGNSASSNPTFGAHTKDYVTAQCYAGDISPTASAVEYIIGLQDNGTQEFDGSSTTSEAVGGDGGFCHIDQDNNQVQIGAYLYNDYTITSDEWASTSTPASAPQTGRFINPTEYDDTNNILYGASNADELCRVIDIGNMNTLTDEISIGGAGLGGEMASCFRVDRNTPTTLYVGTSGGKIYKILNANGGSLTSTDISPGFPAGSYVSSIDVELSNSNHMLATSSSYGIASVWESTDGGSNWTNIENNLPDMPVRWGIFSPHNNDHVILATDLGVWSTDNINGSNTDWAATNNGLANVRCDMIRYRTSDKTIIVATHGRGLYTGEISSSCPADLVITDNPANNTYQASNSLSTSGSVQITTNALFRAGTEIMLAPDFEVILGATFEALIGACQ